MSDFSIIGLLDSFRENGEMYGKKIISLKQCLKNNVKLIIIAARPGSCKAIYNRISEICIEHEIHVMDVRGNKLGIEKNLSLGLEHVNPIFKLQLVEATGIPR